jgi:hypothetical protein
VTGKLQQVHLRINDAATGKPTPVRLRITGADGIYYAPFGRLTRFATEPGVDVGHHVLLDDGPWAIIDGACEIALPPGVLRVQAAKGPEYRPLDTEIHLLPGKMALRLTVERWRDLRAQGWHSGDTCACFLSPHAALLEAAAEDLAVVDLLIREAPAAGDPACSALANISAFSGQAPALAKDGHHVVVNTRNAGPAGTLLLLNSHRVVYPLSFGADERWTLCDWCDQCHRKGGLVVADDWLERAAAGSTEHLTDDFLRHIDAIRFLPDRAIEPWFTVLDRGFRLPLVAGSGKESNRQVLGSWRTYAHVDPATTFDYQAWTKAIKAGRTFVTRGPLLKLSVAGAEVGSVIAGGKCSVAASALATAPLSRLEIVHSGRVIGDHRGSEDLRIHLDDFDVASGWILARCWDAQGTAAVSSPVYLQKDNERA